MASNLEMMMVHECDVCMAKSCQESLGRPEGWVTVRIDHGTSLKAKRPEDFFMCPVCLEAVKGFLRNRRDASGGEPMKEFIESRKRLRWGNG